MKLGYTIDPVSDIAASLHFHESAFGLKRRFLHESGTYGNWTSERRRWPSRRTNSATATSRAATCARTVRPGRWAWKWG